MLKPRQLHTSQNATNDLSATSRAVRLIKDDVVTELPSLHFGIRYTNPHEETGKVKSQTPGGRGVGS